MPLPWEGLPPPAQVAQDPIQTGLECLQGWDTPKLFPKLAFSKLIEIFGYSVITLLETHT